MGTGRWPWQGVVDLRVLVENHAAGKCLVRVTQRVRLRTLPWVLGGAFTLGLAGVAQISGVWLPPASPVLPGLLTLTVAGAVLWAIARPLAAVERAMAGTTEELELLPLVDKPAARRPTALGPAPDTSVDSDSVAVTAGLVQPNRGMAQTLAPADAHGGAGTEKVVPSRRPRPPIPLRPLSMTLDDWQRARRRGGDLAARR